MKIVASLAAVACCSVSAFALAADLPARRVAPVYVPPAVFSWTGFYAGINAGYAFNGDASFALSGTDVLTTNAIAAGTRPNFISTRANGFSGGGQIGYNYELGNSFIPGLGASGSGGLVVGLEADAAYTDLQGLTTYSVTPANLVVPRSTFHAATDFVGTARGRLGFAFGNLLLFGTGGFAYGEVRENANYFSPNGTNNFSGAASALRPGYAYGGGVEYAIPTGSFLNVFNSSAVTLKAEYLHYDLGTSTLVAPNLVGFGNAYVARIHTDGDLVRAGLNYKFDFAPAAPVVARY